MKTSLLLFILPLIAFCASGQTGKGSKDDIHSTRSNHHINIPGTRLFLIPAAGYTQAVGFIGLQKGQKGALQVYDLDGGNYYTNAATFNKEAFEAKGVTVYEYKQLKVNDFPAKYVEMQGDNSARIIGIVFGDSTFSVMVMSYYESSDQKAKDELVSMVRSICYEKSFKVDPLASAAFTVDQTKSRFKFAKSAGGLFLYSPDGVYKEASGDDPMITMLTTPVEAPGTVKTTFDMFIASLKEYGLKDETYKNISTDRINGYESYGAEIQCSMKDKETLIYMIVVSDQKKSVIFEGIAKSDFETNLKEFKKLASTIKFK